MKQDKALIELKERARFYISTPERAAEALLFCKNAEMVVAEIKESVKQRAAKLMDDNGTESIVYTITDEPTGEVREWSVKRDYDKETKEYRAEAVIDAFGLEMAMPYLKVGKTKLETFMKKAVSRQLVTSEQTFKATSNPIIKTKKGSGVIMREIKV